MKSHYLSGILFFLLLPFFLQAQETAPAGNQSGQHTIFLEALGNNAFGSLNYEYRFAQEGKWGMAVKGGGFFAPNKFTRWFMQDYASVNLRGVNVGFSLIQGIGPHYLEFGLGACAMGYTRIYPYRPSMVPAYCIIDTIDGEGNPIQVTRRIATTKFLDRQQYQSFAQNINIGYRFQKPNGGLFFKVSVMAIHYMARMGYRFTDGSTDWENFDHGITPLAGISFGYTFR